jgi:hypothetical protein
VVSVKILMTSCDAKIDKKIQISTKSPWQTQNCQTHTLNHVCHQLQSVMGGVEWGKKTKRKITPKT